MLQRPVNRAFIGNGDQLCPLIVIQVAGQGDLPRKPVNLIGAAAICAILRKRPPLSVCQPSAPPYRDYSRQLSFWVAFMLDC